MSSIFEKECVSKLKSGNLEAFDKLYNVYSPRLYSFAFSILKNKEDAEGIVQEVFLILWKKRNDIDVTKSFKSYLFTISYNLIIDQLRKRLNDRGYLAHLEKFFNPTTKSAEQTDYDIIKSHVDKAINQLPEKRKMIYLLSREKGLSHKEISNQLGISVKTVENQITLTLRFLKKQLGAEILSIVLYLYLFI